MHWRLHLVLASLLEQQHRFDEAIELLAEADEQTHGVDGVVVPLARNHVNAGQPERAIEVLDQMPGLRGHPLGCLVRGLAVRDMGRDLEALSLFRDAAELRPEMASALHHASLTLEDLGRHEEALESARRAAASRDASPAIREHADHLAKGRRRRSVQALRSRLAAGQPVGRRQR